MTIRDIRESDLPILKEWHSAAGFDYTFPEFFEDGKLSPIFASVRVEVDDDDRPIQVLAAKKTVEMYFLLDSTWRNPRWRLEAFSQLHEDMRGQLLAHDLEDVNAWLPPEVEKSFGRKLMRIFGWMPSRWKSYSRRLENK